MNRNNYYIYRYFLQFLIYVKCIRCKIFFIRNFRSLLLKPTCTALIIYIVIFIVVVALRSCQHIKCARSLSIKLVEDNVSSEVLTLPQSCAFYHQQQPKHANSKVQHATCHKFFEMQWACCRRYMYANKSASIYTQTLLHLWMLRRAAGSWWLVSWQQVASGK